MLTFLGNFIVNHWIGLAIIGGILTSTGAAGAAGSNAKKSTEKFLDEQRKLAEEQEKGEKES